MEYEDSPQECERNFVELALIIRISKIHSCTLLFFRQQDLSMRAKNLKRKENV
jgi:hypothetical protein